MGAQHGTQRTKSVDRPRSNRAPARGCIVGARRIVCLRLRTDLESPVGARRVDPLELRADPIHRRRMPIWNRTWSASRWILASFIVACLKYGITAAIYVTLLMASGKPPRARRIPHFAGDRDLSNRRSRSGADGDRSQENWDDPRNRARPGRAAVRGGAQCKSAAASRISSSRATRARAARDPGWSYAPPILGIRVGQPLVTKCADGRTHTLNAFDEGKRYLFNAAILGEREIRFTHPRRHVELHCAIHSDERGYVGSSPIRSSS